MLDACHGETFANSLKHAGSERIVGGLSFLISNIEEARVVGDVAEGIVQLRGKPFRVLDLACLSEVHKHIPKVFELAEGKLVCSALEVNCVPLAYNFLHQLGRVFQVESARAPHQSKLLVEIKVSIGFFSQLLLERLEHLFGNLFLRSVLLELHGHSVKTIKDDLGSELLLVESFLDVLHHFFPELRHLKSSHAETQKSRELTLVIVRSLLDQFNKSRSEGFRFPLEYLPRLEVVPLHLHELTLASSLLKLLLLLGAVLFVELIKVISVEGFPSEGKSLLGEALDAARQGSHVDLVVGALEEGR